MVKGLPVKPPPALSSPLLAPSSATTGPGRSARARPRGSDPATRHVRRSPPAAGSRPRAGPEASRPRRVAPQCQLRGHLRVVQQATQGLDHDALRRRKADADFDPPHEHHLTRLGARNSSSGRPRNSQRSAAPSPAPAPVSARAASAPRPSRETPNIRTRCAIPHLNQQLRLTDLQCEGAHGSRVAALRGPA